MQTNRLLRIVIMVTSFVSLHIMGQQTKDLTVVNDSAWRLLVTYHKGSKTGQAIRRIVESNGDSLIISALDKITKITVRRYGVMGTASPETTIKELDQLKEKPNPKITITATLTGWKFTPSWTTQYEVAPLPQKMVDAFPGVQAQGSKNPRYVLNIPDDATSTEIQEAYEGLMKRWSPEYYASGSDKEKVRKVRDVIDEAYSQLLYSSKKAEPLNLSKFNNLIDQYVVTLEQQIIPQVLKGKSPPLPDTAAIRNVLKSFREEIQRIVAAGDIRTQDKKDIIVTIRGQVDEKTKELKDFLKIIHELKKRAAPNLYQLVKAGYIDSLSQANLTTNFMREVGLLTADNQRNIYGIYQFLGLDPQTARSMNLNEINKRMAQKESQLRQSLGNREEINWLFRQINWFFGLQINKEMYDAFLQGEQAVNHLGITGEILRNVDNFSDNLTSGILTILTDFQAFCNDHIRKLG